MVSPDTEKEQEIYNLVTDVLIAGLNAEEVDDKMVGHALRFLKDNQITGIAGADNKLKELQEAHNARAPYKFNKEASGG